MKFIERLLDKGSVKMERYKLCINFDSIFLITNIDVLHLNVPYTIHNLLISLLMCLAKQQE